MSEAPTGVTVNMIGRDAAPVSITATLEGASLELAFQRTPGGGEQLDLRVHEPYGPPSDVRIDEAQPRVVLQRPTLARPPAYDIRVQTADDDLVATVSVAQGFHAASRPDYLSPLIVNGVPRSGTTLMMRRLAVHPDLVSVEAYPYETRHFIYLLHMMSVVTAPADRERSSTPRDLTGVSPWVGSSPFHSPAHGAHEVLSDAWIQDVADLVRTTSERIYRALPGGAQATMFVEKFCRPPLVDLARRVAPETKELLLVRDPRDVVASMLAFNKKRGNIRFGAERADSPSDFLGQWIRKTTRLVRAYRDRWGDKALPVVRYEDVVRDPHEVMGVLCGRLGIANDKSTIATMIADAAGDGRLRSTHTTSASAGASIGRWTDTFEAKDLQSHDEGLARLERLLSR